MNKRDIKTTLRYSRQVKRYNYQPGTLRYRLFWCKTYMLGRRASKAESDKLWLMIEKGAEGGGFEAFKNEKSRI